MDIRQLRYFLEIVEQNSITAASRTLNIAQPALSHHLRNMEQSLGVALLIRKPTGVEPTEAGHLLASRARSILNDIARTKDEIRNLDQSPVGTVRLAFARHDQRDHHLALNGGFAGTLSAYHVEHGLKP